jgi:hypothetical protein
MVETRTNIIEEHVDPEHRLGRHVHHDDRSRTFMAKQAPALKTTVHQRRCTAFQQGNVGSCTGNALAGMLMTQPYYKPNRVLDESVAKLFYSEATKLDTVPGSWPPNDTGSSSLAVMKAARNCGFIKSYSWTYAMADALAATVLRPGIFGCNWYDSFDHPDSDGVVTITPNAYVRGGHEVELAAIDVERKMIGLWNSWGDWGPMHGQFLMSWSTFDRLLHEQGDCAFAAT